jgi:hypothetical protein
VPVLRVGRDAGLKALRRSSALALTVERKRARG